VEPWNSSVDFEVIHLWFRDWSYPLMVQRLPYPEIPTLNMHKQS